MKKMIALLLTSAMVVGSVTVAFAEDLPGDEGSTNTGYLYYDTTNGGKGLNAKTQDIKVGVVVDDSKVKDVYYVNIEWESMNFKYTFSADAEWDPINHEYSDTNGAWTDTSQTITVTNHSNTKVTASAKFDTADSMTTSGVTATLSDNTATLDSAVGTKVAEAPNKVMTVTVSDVPDVQENFTVGTITVTLAPVASGNGVFGSTN